MNCRAFVTVAALAITGCGTTNNYFADKRQTVEYCRIFDIKTAANRQAVAKAASNGIGRNVNNAQEPPRFLRPAKFRRSPDVSNS